MKATIELYSARKMPGKGRKRRIAAGYIGHLVIDEEYLSVRIHGDLKFGMNQNVTIEEFEDRWPEGAASKIGLGVHFELREGRRCVAVGTITG